MEMNPYEPPNRPSRTPFWTRFFRALRLAYREYRAGMAREKFTIREQFYYYFLMSIVAFVLVWAISMIAIGLIRFAKTGNYYQ
jgi:hypothetical protein